MILDRNAMREGLFGLVGFYNPNNPQYPNLVPSLLTSRSARRVNEVHYLLNDIENIDQSIKNFSHYNYPAYDTAVRDAGGYTEGSKLTFNSLNWEYVADIPSDNATPDPDAAEVATWRQIDELSDYLIKQVYSAVDEMLDRFINAKKMRAKMKSIYESIYLFQGQANYRSLVMNTDNLVGLKIRPKKGQNSIVSVIHRIGHQFTADFGAGNNLPLYLYHSSQQTPIATFQINHRTVRSFEWTNLTDNNILRNVADDYQAGGDFYLGYKQSDLSALGAQALKMDLHWQQYPCKCNAVWYDYYKQYSNYYDVVGFELKESSLGAGNAIQDFDGIPYSYTNNYGLNLNFSTKCDIGYLILQQEELFAEPLQYSVARKLLEAIANTNRNTSLSQQIKRDAEKQIYSNRDTQGTVEDRYRDSVKALEFDMSGMYEDCLACDDGYAEIIQGTITLG